MRACFTIDVEQDCPPYLNTWRGLTEGMQPLLDLLAEEQVAATFFTTGESARRFPKIVRACVDAGHELGCHGDQHRSFATLDRTQAQAELRAASAVLRDFFPVRSFRAPYLKFPADYLGLLIDEGYLIDSSQARYKSLRVKVRQVDGLLRVPASITSSWLRWPGAVRNPILSQLNDPIVVFVHPWEFVDLRRERLRWDCRFRTGEQALQAVRETIQCLRAGSARFVQLHQLLDDGTTAAV